MVQLYNPRRQKAPRQRLGDECLPKKDVDLSEKVLALRQCECYNENVEGDLCDGLKEVRTSHGQQL